MASSLSNFVDNLTEEIHKIKSKDCDYFLEYESVKENSIKYKCLSCNKNYSNKTDKELKWKEIQENIGFLIMISIKSFCCYNKAFILKCIWTIGKVWWSIIAWTRRILKQLKHGRY